MSAPRLIATIVSTAIYACAQAPDSGVDFFEKKVRPLFATHCVACHNTNSASAKLDLSTVQGLARGGESGPLTAKEDFGSSRLLHVISYDEKLKMPPGKKLPESAIADLQSWVRMGAPLPEYKQPAQAVPSGTPTTWSEKKLLHWAFQPIRKLSLPLVKQAAWVQSPIDRFILSSLEAKGLRAPQRADKLTLLRRATFDLHGLAPTEEEMRAFLADDSPDAFAKVVDRLLASPRYGEKWGRHWLDVARYAETGGVDENVAYSEAWRYREYVIDAFNRDLPFSRFVQEQIAGDLLPADTADGVNARGIVATGFLGLGPKAIVEIDKTKTFYDVVDEQIDTTSKAFLGLTISCARCHDHKFDPISTKDYYSLAAVFANTRSFENNVDRGSRTYLAPLVPAEVYARYRAHQDKIAGKKMQTAALLENELWKDSSDTLFSRTADYMMAAWKAQRGASTTENLAQPENLDERVLKSWVKYLDPKAGFRPHLKEWHDATESNVASISRVYEERFRKSAERWAAVLRDWKSETDAAVRAGTKLPKTPNVEYNDGKATFNDPNDRFFVEIAIPARTLNDRTSVDGPFVVPEAEQEKRIPATVREQLAALRSEAETLTKMSPPEPPMAHAVSEGPAVQQKIFIRGSHFSPGETVTPGVPEILRTGQAQAPPVGSGRKPLADWLTDAKNPLTPRVIVNRIWQWHFGTGLVRTPNNFGLMGALPTHPELLDYLASTFVENGGSMKAMHRLLMTSSAYQSSSAVTDAVWQADPENRLYSRFQRRRIEIEEMRDTWLQLTGKLELKTGGIFDPVDAPAPSGREARRGGPSPRSFEASRRRSVYLAVNRTVVATPMALNDFVDSTTSAGDRPETITAPQALYLMNNPFVIEQAKLFAERLLADVTVSEQDRIRRGFRMAWNREPSDADINRVVEHLRKYPGDSGQTTAWHSFCRMLLSSNQFHYID